MPSVKVAIVTQDVFGQRLAGPAIRAMAMGRRLAEVGHDVRVHSTAAASGSMDLVVRGRLDGAAAVDLARWADVVVVQGDVLDACPGLGRGDGVLVADLYDPFQLEGLVRGVDLPERARYGATRRALSVLTGQLERADFFLCASERQRLFWLGHLDAAGRVNPATHDADPTLQSLIAIAPFGMDERPPERDGPGLRGRIDGIHDGSRIVLWGGGVYDWLDPLPAIEAMASLVDDVPEARLVFMGTVHPNPAVSPSAMLTRARALVREMRLEQAVLFHEGWVPYEERHNVLLDAEIGLSGHLLHMETALAFRTRILDYLWAGLPVVTTEGDALGDLVERHDLGVVVPPSDPTAVASALRSLLVESGRADAVRRSIAQIVPSLRWSAALAPLVDYCADPRPAPDRNQGEAARLRRDRAPGRSERSARIRTAIGSASDVLWDDGPRGVARKLRARVQRRRAG